MIREVTRTVIASMFSAACFCIEHYCKEEPWECHTTADCAKMDKCKKLAVEGRRSCSCRSNTCEKSECATKVGRVVPSV